MRAFFFFKQKTAYEMRISDWSSDLCSSDLFERVQTEVKTGMRQSQPIAAGRRTIEAGEFFVLDGITLYVAAIGEPLKTTAGEVDRPLSLLFATGTDSTLLLRSLPRAF